MKLSKYSLFHEIEEKLYIYHQISDSLLEIDKELYDTLNSNDINSLPSDISSCLQNKGFIINDDVKESDSIYYANLKIRYSSQLLRVTILPTIDCNFRCWYCYEEHKPSMLKEKDAKAIQAFIINEAESKHIKEIIIDWFGGEPLLYFSKIVYPISKEVKSWCEAHDVSFFNTITTNGSLINERMAAKMNEISLTQIQITLDGGKEHHNKTRFSPSMTDSYSVIVKNIHALCRKIDNASVELRINYTPENIDSTYDILDDFDSSIRNKITVSPHIVWQKSADMERLSSKSELLRKTASTKGYCIHTPCSSRRCVSCYTENMEQFVINYDMNVYKCTARDFDKKFSIGKISDEGKFIPNDFYYKYYVTQSPFIGEKCMDCELLPSCLYSASCIQKKIENFKPECRKEMIMQSVKNDIACKVRKNNISQ